MGTIQDMTLVPNATQNLWLNVLYSHVPPESYMATCNWAIKSQNAELSSRLPNPKFFSSTIKCFRTNNESVQSQYGFYDILHIYKLCVCVCVCINNTIYLKASITSSNISLGITNNGSNHYYITAVFIVSKYLSFCCCIYFVYQKDLFSLV